MRFETWEGLTPYAEGMARMDAAVAEVLAGGPERVFLLEHAAVLTVGSGASLADAGSGHDVPIAQSNRGGQVTYHGPGQRVIYPILRLDARWQDDIRVYMRWMQQWVQQACQSLGVETELRTGTALGLWVNDAKLAAFGVRVRQRGGVKVAFHGAALNVMNDTQIYSHFTPCGLVGSKATRLRDVRPALTMKDADAALQAIFKLPAATR